MGSKAIPGGGAMPSPGARYEYEHPTIGRLMKALGTTPNELGRRNVGVTKVQVIGEDVIVTAYAGGKLSNHVDKIDRFPSEALLDKLRVLF
jgi:hypothetical protein